MTTLPHWPRRTIAVLSTIDPDPHAIPVSAPVRASDTRILLALRDSRDSLARLRHRPRIALTVLAEGNVAFTARGCAHVVDEPFCGDYAAVAIDVEHVDDHRQPAFRIESGAGRDWIDEGERRALGERVEALAQIASADQLIAR
jgi:hypothetical protein